MALHLQRPLLILGCGFVGSELAKIRLKSNLISLGWVESPNSAILLTNNGISALSGDLTKAQSWECLNPYDFSAIVHCASSNRGDSTAYQAIYVQALRYAIQYARGLPVIFVSSTSVYGQTDGSIVTECSTTEPIEQTSKILLEAEDLVLTAGGTVVRLAGIYGPGRARLVEKFLKREAVIDGAGDRFINQIHRDDAALLLYHLVKINCPQGIYNGVDDYPISYCDYYKWCSHYFSLPLPSYGTVVKLRKRGLTNKRVLNDKSKSTGWTPHYPSFREGVPSLFTKEGYQKAVEQEYPITIALDYQVNVQRKELESTILNKSISDNSSYLRLFRVCILIIFVIILSETLYASADVLVWIVPQNKCVYISYFNSGMPLYDLISASTSNNNNGVSIFGVSPDGLWILQARSLGIDAGGIVRQEIGLVCRRTGIQCLNWVGRQRAVSVLWSPNGSLAAVNDFSNLQGDCLYIIDLRSIKPRLLHTPDHLNLYRNASATIKKEGLIHRITQAAEGWKDSTTLEVRVFGKSASGPFDTRSFWSFQNTDSGIVVEAIRHK